MGFDSMGMMGQATGTVSGNTWSWTGEDKMGGKLIKSKYTIVMVIADFADVQMGRPPTTAARPGRLAAEGKSTKK